MIKRSKYAGFPGLIVEHAYVSNNDDSTTFLNGNDRLKRLGVADATGIAEYFDLILDQAPVLQTPVVNADESVTLAWNTVQGLIIIVFTAESRGRKHMSVSKKQRKPDTRIPG